MTSGLSTIYAFSLYNKITPSATNLVIYNGTLLVSGIPGYNSSYQSFMFGNTTTNGGTIMNLSGSISASYVLCVGGGGAGGQGGTVTNGGGGGGAQVILNSTYTIPSGNTVINVAPGCSTSDAITTDNNGTGIATTINNLSTVLTAYSGKAGGYNNSLYSGSSNPSNSGGGGGGSGSSSIAYSGGSPGSYGFLGGSGTIGTGLPFKAAYTVATTNIAVSNAIANKSMSIILYSGTGTLTGATNAIYFTTNYGNTWNNRTLKATSVGNSSGSICMSDDGIYLYYIYNGYFNNISPIVATSSNFGLTVLYTTNIPTQPGITNSFLSCSTSGKYVLLTFSSTNPAYSPYLSSNYGNTFTSQTFFTVFPYISGVNNMQVPDIAHFLYNSTATFIFNISSTSTTPCIQIVDFISNSVNRFSFNGITTITSTWYVSSMKFSYDKTYISALLSYTTNLSKLICSTNSGSSFFYPSNKTIAPNYGTIFGATFNYSSLRFGSRFMTFGMSITGQYQCFSANYNAVSGLAAFSIFLSTNYGVSYYSVDPTDLYPYNSYHPTSNLISGDGSIVHVGLYGIGYIYVIKGMDFNYSRYGIGGGGGGMGSIGYSSGIAGSGSLISLTTQYYGGGGYGGGAIPLYSSNISGGGGYGSNNLVNSYSGNPGSGGGGGGGSISYTTSGQGGSGLCAVYFPTTYDFSYTSTNPPNQYYIGGVLQGGAPTSTSILALLTSYLANGTLTFITSGSFANPASYQISGTTPLYNNGYYTIQSSVPVSGSNCPSYLLSTNSSVTTVFTFSSSKYINYTGTTFTYNQITSVYSGWIGGEWFQFQMPYSFILTQYRFDIYNNGIYPTSLYLFGSNDNVLFYLLSTSFSTFPNGSTTPTTISSSNINNVILSNAYFSIYRFVVPTMSSTGNGSSTFTAYNLNLYN